MEKVIFDVKNVETEMTVLNFMVMCKSFISMTKIPLDKTA